MSGWRRRTTRLALGVGFCGFAVAAPAVFRADAAEIPFGFVASAAADGFRVTETVNQVPLFPTTVDLGATNAQAEMDSTGASRAHAAVPEPGGTIAGPASGGSLVTCQFQCVTPPASPTAVASEYPTRPKAAFQSGPVSLKATSTDSWSVGSAVVAAGSPAEDGISTEAVIKTADEKVASSATSIVNGFKVGPLDLGAVRSSAKVVRSVSGVDIASSFTVTGATVNGTTVGVGPGGVLIGGSAVPVPDTSSVQVALARAGVTLTYLAPRKTDDGVVSAGLSVLVKGGIPNQADGAVEYVFGRARAFVSAAAAEAVSDIVDVPPVAVPGPGGVESAAVPPSSTGPSAEPPQPGIEEAPPQAAPAVPLAGTPPDGSAVAQGAPMQTDAAAAGRPVGRLPGALDASPYLVLVGAAFAVFLSLQLIRLLGVRAP